MKTLRIIAQVFLLAGVVLGILSPIIYWFMHPEKTQMEVLQTQWTNYLSAIAALVMLILLKNDK